VPIINVATHVRQRADRMPRTNEIRVEILNYLAVLTFIDIKYPYPA